MSEIQPAMENSMQQALLMCCWSNRQCEMATEVIIKSRVQLARRLQSIRSNAHRKMMLAAAAYLMSETIPRPLRMRSVWMKPRSSQWWEVVKMTFGDEQWKGSFRMRRSTFDTLCRKLHPFLKNSSETFAREPLPVDKRVAIALYKLANCSKYNVVGELFGVHRSTVHNCLYKVCMALLKLHDEVIYMPTSVESLEIADRIEAKYGLPQIMGVIGGVHVPISSPKCSKCDYMNRKGWASFILQAVVDDQYCFRDVNCNIPGSACNAGTMAASMVKQNESQSPTEPMIIDGEPIPLMVVGDPAYPLLPWLMRGYVGADLAPDEESFNAHLGSVCMLIETAFGRLKTRWQMLCKRNNVNYLFVPTVVGACCVLHNFCETENETIDRLWTEEANHMERMLPQPDSQVVDSSDTNVRRVLKDYMARNFDIG